MVFVLILSGLLLFTTFTYLLVAHYVLAREVGKTLKNKPPDESFSFNKSGAWLTYFDDLSQEFYDRFFKYKAKPGTSEYESEKREKLNQYRNLLLRMSPFVPKMFLVIFLQQAFNQISDSLFTKFPISISRINEICFSIPFVRLFSTPII
jgi:hypothetical protein